MKREKAMGLYALLMLTVFVLFLPPEGYRNLVGPKHWMFVLLTAAVFLYLPLWKLRKSWPLIFAGALLFWTFLSSLCSAYPEVVWMGSRRREGFFTLALYLGVFLLMANHGKLGRAHSWALGVTAILEFSLILLQIFGKNPFSLYPNDWNFYHRGIAYSGEYLGTIGNSDLLSAWLTMSALFLLGSYAVSPKKERFFFLFAGICAGWSLLFSEVQAGLVGFLGALFLGLLLCIWKGIGLRRMGVLFSALCLCFLGKSLVFCNENPEALEFSVRFGWMQMLWSFGILAGLLAEIFLRKLPEGKGYPNIARNILIFVVILALLVLIFLFFYEGNQPTLQGLSQLLHGNPPDTLGSSRIRIWKEAGSLALEEPLLGSGPDTYGKRSSIVFEKELPSGQVRRTSVDAAHNEYLNILVHLGIPGLLLYLCLLGSVLIPAIRKKCSLPLLLSCLGYGIHACFGISQSVVSPIFYLFLGALFHSISGDEPA